MSWFPADLSRNCSAVKYFTGLPLGLENLEKWKGIFQSGKSCGILNRLEKSRKSQGKSHKILEKLGNFEHTGKVRENYTKYWKGQGILPVPKSGNHVLGATLYCHSEFS